MKKLVIAVIVFIAATAGWWRWTHPSATVNFRMIYEVETPEGIKTGSMVRSATWGMLNGTIGHSFWCATKGEAIPIDLSPRGTLYALLSSPSAPDDDCQVTLLIDVYGIRASTDQHEARSIRNFSAIAGRREVTYDQPWPIADAHKTMATVLPTLVRFLNEADPKSVEAVDPSNLAASFGEGCG